MDILFLVQSCGTIDADGAIYEVIEWQLHQAQRVAIIRIKELEPVILAPL